MYTYVIAKLYYFLFNFVKLNCEQYQFYSDCNKRLLKNRFMNSFVMVRLCIQYIVKKKQIQCTIL